jgi:uncharacterized protein DUF6790
VSPRAQEDGVHPRLQSGSSMRPLNFTVSPHNARTFASQDLELRTLYCMYYIIVTVFMFVLPLLSVAVELMATHASIGAAILCKWFAFWSVGWRLLLAGVKQIAQPQYTAHMILGLKDRESLILVRELGFANVAVGFLGVLSLLVPSWQLAAALTGGMFYALAGTNHMFQMHRNRLQNVAMLSDIFAAVVLLGACAVAVLSKRPPGLFAA